MAVTITVLGGNEDYTFIWPLKAIVTMIQLVDLSLSVKAKRASGMGHNTMIQLINPFISGVRSDLYAQA